MFDKIIKNIVGNILKGSILVFDLGYYDSERFKTLDEKCILFVTRIKSNIKYEIIDIKGKSKITKIGKQWLYFKACINQKRYR